MSDEWLTFPAAVQLVRVRLQCSIGHAEAIARTAKDSGEVQHKPDPILLTADDGVIGMHLRPVKFGAAQTRDDGQMSRDDLLDWLGRQAPAHAPARKQGRKAAKIKTAAIAIWGKEGPPGYCDDKVICSEIMDWHKQNGGELKVSDKHIVRTVRKIYSSSNGPQNI